MAKLTHPDLDATIDVPDAAVPSLLRKGWQSHEGGLTDLLPFVDRRRPIEGAVFAGAPFEAQMIPAQFDATPLHPWGEADSTIAPATPGDASEGTPSLTSQEG